MRTDSRTEPLEFEGVGGRRVVADFRGGAMTSDAGTLLLRHTDRAIGLIRCWRCWPSGLSRSGPIAPFWLAKARVAEARKFAVSLRSMWRDGAAFRFGKQPELIAP